MLAALASLAIRTYKVTLSPFMAGRCRFYPSCSDYALSCLEKYSTATAFKRTIVRIGRCHPFHPGGVDLP